jgi:predicted hydrocarbon binding protein
VRKGVVKLTGAFCFCSRGWVKAIFEALLKRPVRVELEKAIGFGDEVCKYNVNYQH